MASEPVVVVGTLAFDLVARAPRLAGPDEAVRLDSLETTFGGPVGNVTRRLAALGVRTEARSTVGPDFLSSEYARVLREDGVGLDGVVETETETARVFVVTDAHDRQSIYYHRGASVHMDRVPSDGAGIALFAPGELTPYARIMRACDRVLFDPGPETFHWPGEALGPCIEESHILFANAHELERIQRLVGPVDTLLDMGLEAVVETRGADPCRVHTSDGRTDVPGLQAEVVDPTGAGDAHRAGFVAAQLWGWDLLDSLRFGNTSAAFAVETMGAQTDIPSLATVLDRYEGRYGTAPPRSDP